MQWQSNSDVATLLPQAIITAKFKPETNKTYQSPAHEEDLNCRSFQYNSPHAFYCMVLTQATNYSSSGATTKL
uniref:Uncharacterized protein n=1 Tax=Rhizophora mucronata TaxID=61149 RepID=A0A2P2QC76_RHIMU